MRAFLQSGLPGHAPRATWVLEQSGEPMGAVRCRTRGDHGVSAPRPDDAGPGRGLTALLFVDRLASTFFVGLSSTPPLWDANEPLYAQPPKEVLEWPQGDFWAPTWNGKPYFAHAPLSTWITVPAYTAVGSTEFGHRVPMALACVLTILATWRLGRQLGGRRTALFAALILAATPRFWLFGRQLSGDVYMTAILVVAWSLALPAVAGRTTSRRDLRIANVLVGLGFTAKGPVIAVLYFGVLFFAWLLGRPRATWSFLRPWRALLLVVLVGSPWFVYMAIRYEHLDFLGKHFGHYHYGRVIGNIGQRGLLFYPRILLGDGQPWITVAPFAVWHLWQRRDRRVEALLPWAGIAWLLVFFALPQGKRNVYLLPLYPLLAMGLAPLAQALWRGAFRPGVRLAGVGAAVGCTGGAIMLWAMARNVPELTPEIWFLTAAIAAPAIPFLVAGWRGHGRLVFGGAIVVVLACQVAGALAFPALARFRPVPAMAERIRADQSAPDPEPAVIYRVAIHSLNFYLDRPTRVAGSADDLLAKMGEARRAFVLVPEHRYSAPGKGDGPARVGLLHELPEGRFTELERRPLLIFKFRWTILGQDKTTRDLLLVRLDLDEPASAVLAARGGGR